MITAMRRHTKLGLALLASTLALTLGLISGAASAQAAISTYCGGWLYGASEPCFGAQRWLYEVYGWGEQGGVCVEISNQSTMACVNKANQGVYSGTKLGYNTWGTPVIVNYSGGSNFVHGLAGRY